MYKYLLFTFFLAEGSFAGFSNYNSILIGDLSAGMGGAATAVVGDVSSSSFYNPATLGKLKGEAFSATVGIFKKFDTVYGTNEALTQAPMRVNQGFFRSLPASTGNVIDFYGYKLGLSIVVPDYDMYRGELQKTATNLSTMNFVDESLWVGGSISKAINDKESYGLTIYYTARSFVRSINDRSNPSTTETTIYNQDKNITENSVLGILGYHYDINSKWSVGASFRTPAIRIAGQANINESLTYMNTNTNTLTVNSPTIPTLGAAAMIPAKLGVGAAYMPNSKWLWAADLSVFEGLSYDDVSDPNYSNRINKRSVWNLSFGGQWSYADWIHFRSGIFTNFSAHPDPDPALSKLQEDRVDMLGFSANFLFLAKNKVGYTFGGYYTGGRGKATQRIDQQIEIVTKTQHVFTMLVGTHFYF